MSPNILRGDNVKRQLSLQSPLLLVLSFLLFLLLLLLTAHARPLRVQLSPEAQCRLHGVPLVSLVSGIWYIAQAQSLSVPPKARQIPPNCHTPVLVD